MLWSYLLIGFITGVCSGLLGLGGGFILIPLLLLAQVPMEVAVSTSLVFVFFSAASGSIRHGFQGTIDARLAAAVALPSIVTTFAGSLLTVRVPASFLQTLLGICALGSLYLFNRTCTSEGDPAVSGPPRRWMYTRTAGRGDEVVTYSVDVPKGIGVGCVVGFLAGLLGVGGGFLMIPAFVGFMAVPLRVAIGTSLLTILASALVGTVGHWGQGSLDWTIAWTTVLTGVIGAQIGAALVSKLSEKLLKALLNGLLVLGALYLFLKAFAGI
jgi:uncharacterized membrane protein YfcA